MIEEKILPFVLTPHLPKGEMFTNGEAGVIEVYYKTQFGRGEWHISDPIQKAALFDLTKKKTLNPQRMNALKALGFRLVHVCDGQEDDHA